MSEETAAFGLYVHVPFCKALCHYCDFAKTANFSADLATTYLARLKDHLQTWMASAAVRTAAPRKLTSVFFGGGTPSLFAREFEPLMTAIAPFLAPGAEISLEANPDDVSAETCRIWRALGVTRLSVGVQTFHADGLARLKRVHGASEAERALGLALECFPSVNADLIYGWNGQSEAIWQSDLQRVLRQGVQHLSLYNLTFAAGTPIGRAVARGKMAPQTDDRLAAYFERARDLLGAAGFVHEEVSNWAQPGHTCRHNWLYWDAGPFIGIGAGAHGYLPDWQASPGGVRWEYGRNERRFLTPQSLSLQESKAPADYAQVLGADVHAARTPDDWLLEYVGCGLRTERGIDLARIRHKTGFGLAPRPLLARALAEGLMTRAGDVVRLVPAEWFRETAWSLELILSLNER